MQKVAKELAAERTSEKLRPSPAWQKAEQKRIEASLTRFPECIGIHHNSHMGEATADWIGTHVLGSYLTDQAKKGNKLDTPTKKLSAIGFAASLVCMRHFADEAASPTERLETSRIIDDYRALGDPHPGSKSRLEKIILRNSAVRKALGCAPHDDECGKKWMI